MWPAVLFFLLFLAKLPPHPCFDHSQLFWASCLPLTFSTFLSIPWVTLWALWSCAKLPFAKLPSILPEAHHHRLPLGDGMMRRHKPLTGVLLLGWIHEDSLEAQWSWGPLARSSARDASEPSASYNRYHAAMDLVAHGTWKQTHKP